MNKENFTDICIIGGGTVGLSTAYQILERYSHLSITMIDKEERIIKE